EADHAVGLRVLHLDGPLGVPQGLLRHVHVDREGIGVLPLFLVEARRGEPRDLGALEVLLVLGLVERGAAHAGEDLLVLDQLLVAGPGPGGVGSAVVTVDVVETPAVDATGVVDGPDDGLHLPVHRLDGQVAQGVAVHEDAADLDRVAGHADVGRAGVGGIGAGAALDTAGRSLTGGRAGLGRGRRRRGRGRPAGRGAGRRLRRGSRRGLR